MRERSRAACASGCALLCCIRLCISHVCLSKQTPHNATHFHTQAEIRNTQAKSDRNDGIISCSINALPCSLIKRLLLADACQDRRLSADSETLPNHLHIILHLQTYLSMPESTWQKFCCLQETVVATVCPGMSEPGQLPISAWLFWFIMVVLVLNLCCSNICSYQLYGRLPTHVAHLVAADILP